MLVHHTDLINSFAQHPADELEQLQMVVLQAGRGRRVQALLARHAEQVQRRIEHTLYRLFQEF